jgi:glucose-1-phosphate thymidylyltransferase
MRGIVLAGGSGSRLHPITVGASKQLLPVYDKPMIYYPLSTLMLAGIRDILVVTTPADATAFGRLLGDGAQFGISITYAVQPRPDGLASAFVLGRDHIGTEPVALALGDNIFHGPGLGSRLGEFTEIDGGKIFAYRVADPSAYGVVEFDERCRVVSLEEKPKRQQRRGRHRGQSAPVRPRRVRDHRRKSRVPGSGHTVGRGVTPRDGLA